MKTATIDAFKRRRVLPEKWWWLFVVVGAFWVLWQAMPVVVFMKPIPETWCVAPTFVQARLVGIKVKSLKPVNGSWIGRVKHGDDVEDAAFEFVNDVSPGSAKPKYATDFGVWRWYDADATAVRMAMRHADPDDLLWSKDDREIYSSSRESVYGFYDVPENIEECAP